MVILAILLLASLGYYLWFLLSVWRGLKRQGSPHRVDGSGSVSVVVAARNEEGTITRCLQSLLGQTYPADAYEIIVVDDHSTDRTAAIVTEMAAAAPPMPIILLSLGERSASSGKPSAIAQGVRQARGEVILCTDADCVLPRGWIRSMAGQFGPGVAFVAGPVLEAPVGSFLSRIQGLEFLGLITTAAGLIGAQKPIICNGANIAYRKSAFEAVDGYGDGHGSCDDETLMQRIAMREVGSISFNKDPEAVVLTSTPRSIREFWRQRTRWAAKRGRYESKAILARLLLLYSFFPIVVVAAIAAVFEPWIAIVVIASFLVKACADYVVLREGARMLRQAVPLGQFLVAELLHVPYIACAGLIGQFGSIRWKERNLQT